MPCLHWANFLTHSIYMELIFTERIGENTISFFIGHTKISFIMFSNPIGVT
jgi:hypothetical protein